MGGFLGRGGVASVPLKVSCKVFGTEFSDTPQGVKVLGAIQKLLGKLLEKLLNSPVVKVSRKVSEAEFSEAPKGG